MLFTAPFKALIRAGSLQVTYRTWATPRVKVGNSYRLGPADTVVVTALDRVSFGSLTRSAARRAGFDDLGTLHAALRRTAKAALARDSQVFRVRFRYEQRADTRIALREHVAEEALDEVGERLARMDALGRRGQWTIATLRLIDAHPNVAASRLAQRVQRPTAGFKADVRKLKELGLTISHEVGYSLSPRGRAFLRRLRRRR